MNIKPKKGILLIRCHKNTALKADIAIEDNDEDKRLITGEVLESREEYSKGSTVIFGRYAIYKLTIQSEDFFLLEESDVIDVCSYKELNK